MKPTTVARALASVISAGEIEEERIVNVAAKMLGKRWRWLRPLARRLESRFADAKRPRAVAVHKVIAEDAGFQKACSKYTISIECLLFDHEMRSAHERLQDVPPIVTVGGLCEWLGTSRRELEWLADRGGFERRDPRGPVRYQYLVLSRGSRRQRIIESPCGLLKSVQRQIVDGVLQHVPRHAAAHGWYRGRSIRTFVAPHIGKPVVLKMDLQSFFPSITGPRVSGLFRALGYPDHIADYLAALTTNATPDSVTASATTLAQHDRRRYAQPHLPQGAPSSPAIANNCVYRLDCRLSGFAESCGAAYTRYGDDLALSGGEDFARCVQRVQHHVAAIILDEGLRVNFRKTRIMRGSVRQMLTGVVVNDKANICRREFDRLRAILHNCVQHGPTSQNRNNHLDFRSHLAGRIAFVESLNPVKGARLRETFARIDWP